MHEVSAYVDGACSNNPGPMGAGVLLVFGPHRRSIGRYLGEGTNNVAELSAIKIALEMLKDRSKCELIVVTDSKYCIGVLMNGWKVQSNTELVKTIRALAKECPKFGMRHGHSKEAHTLARSAIKMRGNWDERS